MFTTGSKFFFGASALAGGAALVYALSSGNPIFTGTIVLVGLALTAAFLGGVVVAFRDVTRPVAAGPDALVPPQRAAPPSIWPVLVAFAAGTVALGIAVDNRAFLLGAAALLVLAIEWAVQAWSDGASGDESYNLGVRSRFMHAIEFPVLGILGAAFVAFLFSRVMLTLHETAAVVVFIVLGAVVLAGATLLASAPPGAAKRLLPLFLVVGAAGLLAAGVVGAVRGEADHHELKEKAGNAVALKSNPEAVIRLAGGTFSTGDLVIPKGTFTNLLFRNDDPGERALFVKGRRSVKEGTKTEVLEFTERTDLIGEGKVAFLAVRFEKSGEYEYWVEDEEAHRVTEAKVIVP